MSCKPGCTCGRHRSNACQPGCTCARHRGKQFTGELDYFGAHVRVRKVRGRANTHDCVRCGKQARHWATIHDTPGRDPHKDFQPMCISCHQEYDQSHKTAGFHGRRHSTETKRRMSETRKGKSWLDSASDEDRRRFAQQVSDGCKGRVPWNKGLKGAQVAWNKGRRKSQ